MSTCEPAEPTALEIISGLLVSTGPAELGQRLAEQLRQLTGAAIVVLGGPTANAPGCGMVAASPRDSGALFTTAELEAFRAARPLTTELLRTAELAAADPRRPPLVRASVDAFVCLPLVAAGDSVGVLLLLDLPPADQAGVARAVLGPLSPLIALALRSTFAHQQTERLARQLERHARELEADVAARTSELEAVTAAQAEARLAALNMMEDAVAARSRAEQALADLRQEMAARQQVEAALRISEHHYRLLFEHNPLPMWVYDQDTLGFLAVNESAINHYGYTREEFLGMTLRDIRPPEDVPALHRRVAELGTLISRSREWRHRRKDGTEISVEITSHALQFGGRRARLVLAHDITERKRAEAALQERTRYIETVLENAPIGFAVNTIDDGQGRFVSARFEQIYGVPRGSLQSVGDYFEKVYRDPVFREQMRERIMSDLASGDTARMRWQNIPLPQESGGTRYITAVNIPLLDQNLMVSTVQDVTTSVQARQALERDEAELSAIYEHAPVMLLLIDGRGQVRRLNRAAQDFTGRSSADTAGKGPGDVLGCRHALEHPSGCGFSAACQDCALRHAVVDSLETGAIHRRVETRVHPVRGRDLLEITVLVSSARIEVEQQAMVLLCLEDISQQKLAEQRVREQAALLDVTRDAILVVDLEGRVTYCNRAAEQLYGWPAAEAIGRPVGELVFDGSPPELTAALQTIRATGQWSGEWRQRSRTGTPIVAACRGVLMTDPAGAARSMLLTASDVTEAKRLEAQYLRAQRLESLGSLASGVAHDLNNVFTPIMMSVELLHGLARERADQEIVRLLRDSARRGADIVHQLLLFGRGTDAPRQPVDLAKVVAEIGRLIQQTFPKNIVLATQTPAGLGRVHGDPTQLHQVLLNLCVNARDAMPQGGRLTLSVESREVDAALARDNLGAQTGPHVVLRVADTGTGIAPENLDKIFDPFFTTKAVGQGSGLGLATVLGITRSHGGFVTVQSRPGLGTEFAVLLPAQSATDGVRMEVPSRVAPCGRGELILVVDDEPAIRQVLLRALRQHGYGVMLASDGQMAKEVFTAHAGEIRLLLTDIMMPGVDGLETIKAVRRMRPQLPVLAVSGIRSHRQDLERLGPPAVRFVAKPFTLEELLPVVRQMLDAPY